MFTTSKRRVVAGLLSFGVVLSGVAVSGGTVSANEPCITRTTKKAFAQWGDNNNYFPATNGTFESGAGGWTMTGSVSVVNDQAPWKVNGSNHSKALRISTNASATTTRMCVASDEEWLRLFYRDPGVGNSSLQVHVVVTNGNGNRADNMYTIGSNGAGWKVSPQIHLPDIRDSRGEQFIQVTFRPVNTQATWSIDDVMIDPWRTR